MFEGPTNRTPVQVGAVFKGLNDLLESVCSRNGAQIYQLQRLNRLVKTLAILANLVYEDVPS